jgi:hypothetical protein
MRIMKIFILVSIIFAFDICVEGKLIAYPVPFDPAHQTLRLKYAPVLGAGNVRVQIYDINGDLVLSRSYSSIAGFIWKGYTDSGKRVATGLYIIKVRWEDSATGKIKIDTVRVTVVERTK